MCGMQNTTLLSGHLWLEIVSMVLKHVSILIVVGADEVGQHVEESEMASVVHCDCWRNTKTINTEGEKGSGDWRRGYVIKADCFDQRINDRRRWGDSCTRWFYDGDQWCRRERGQTGNLRTENDYLSGEWDGRLFNSETPYNFVTKTGVLFVPGQT